MKTNTLKKQHCRNENIHACDFMIVMYENIKRKIRQMRKEELGMGTIEIVIIIAVLIGLAFLFRTFAVSFFTELTEGIKDNNQIDELFTSP